MTQWIDGDGERIGDTGFLVEVLREGRSSFRLQDSPPRTNRSHEPRLHGWCGETNNVSVYGRGLVRVVRTARNGRVFVVPVAESELPDLLESAGYPELAP